jgi:hypothetical protein
MFLQPMLFIKKKTNHIKIHFQIANTDSSTALSSCSDVSENLRNLKGNKEILGSFYLAQL